MKILTTMTNSAGYSGWCNYFSWKYTVSYLYKYLWLFCFAALLVTNKPVYAVVSPDGTLGTVVNHVSTDYAITGGTQNNTNLFHSFSNFDLVAGESATFSGATSVTNIIGRVTSGQASSIDGQINSGIAGASLWLVNPAGMVFGSNASLNTSGSFHVTTADYLVLGSQAGRFDASNPASTVLSSAAPSAFGFLDNMIAAINFNGSTLKVADGKTMSVIGGNIDLVDASLNASGGIINMAAVASVGEVQLNSSGINTTEISDYGDISVTQTTFITGRPTDASFRPLANIDASGDSGGKIYIRSGRFEMDNGYVFSDTHDTGTGGLVDIVSDTVALTKEARITTDAGNKGGSGGDINISADTVSLTQGAQLSVSSYGTGNAGTVTINAQTSVILDEKSPDEPHLFAGVTKTPRESAITAEAYGMGKGGDVNITTQLLQLKNESLITAVTSREGNAGYIQLNINDLDVLSGSAINSNTFGDGDGGDIDINASGAVHISGAIANDDINNPWLESGIITNNYSSGNGGNINITASDLSISDRGVVQVNLGNDPTFQQPDPNSTRLGGNVNISAPDITLVSGGQITSLNTDGGTSGVIAITSENISISGQTSDASQTSGFFSSTTSADNGGVINLTTNQLIMSDNATINTSTISDGNAGSIQIDTSDVLLSQGARISSSTGRTGDGGSIAVQASADISIMGTGIDGHSSGFYTVAQVSEGQVPADVSGNAGLITLTANKFTLSDSGVISARSEGSGNAGQISLASQTALQMYSDASISTEALNGGNAGSIQLDTSDVLLSQGARISSSTGSTGDGGSIVVQAGAEISIMGTGIDGHSSGFYTVAQVSDGQVSADVSGNAGSITLTANKFTISDSGVISARSEGIGNAGQVSLISQTNLEMFSDASISTEALSGGGGQINIVANDLLRLDNASITSSVADGSGNGGDINIDPIFITLQNGSSITANAFAGNGGNINMVASYYFQSSDSLVQASSQLGIDGVIDITSPDTDVSGSLTDLPEEFLNASALLRSKCAARSANSQSSLVVGGRGGIPPSPADLIGISPLSMLDIVPVTAVIKNNNRTFVMESGGCTV